MGDIVCISHLRWDFVWQRPQHILSRLAQQHRILFVEEPITNTQETQHRLEIIPAAKAPNVTVARLIHPTQHDHWIGHDDPASRQVYSHLVREYIQQQGFQDTVLWLYTPMAFDFVSHVKHKVLVYDVMDQLSAFRGAPASLAGLEQQLLQKANLVFTGGASLYRNKLTANPATYLFPSGVETEHFAKANEPETFAKPADLANIAAPIIGYFGVIDERMDFGLLEYMANSHPEWQIVLLGPILKVGPHELPQAPNLHYLGMKSYDELPAYLAFFDVAMVPFVLNESTEFLSPTKTLEYMAAHKPIVATPIRDIVELYGEVVRIGHDHNEFINHVQTALNENPYQRLAKENDLLLQYTWNNIANRMQLLIDAQLNSPSDLDLLTH